MREKRFGRIIFISSESGVQMPTEMIHYGFTKAADTTSVSGGFPRVVMRLNLR